MKKVKIRFTRGPAGAFRLAYFAGDVTELPEKQAEHLIKQGFAEPYKSEADDESDLPMEIPYRHVLVGLGMTLEDVKNAEDLTQLNGIGEKSAEQIKQWLADNEA